MRRSDSARNGDNRRFGNYMSYDLDFIFKIAGIGIIVTFVSILLKKAERDDVAQLVVISGVVIVLLMVLELVSTLFSAIKGILL